MSNPLGNGCDSGCGCVSDDFDFSFVSDCRFVSLCSVLPSATAATGAASSSEGSTAVLEKPIQALSTSEVRTKLGYLNTGDAIRITSELDRLKSRGTINLWNCKSNATHELA